MDGPFSQIILRSNVFSSSIFLPKVEICGSKWQWSTQQASSMYQMHGTSLLSTPLPLWTSIITLGKKNDDKKHCFLK